MKKKYVILLAIFVIILGGIIAITMVIKSMEKGLNQLAASTISDVDLTTLEDGVYTGSYQVLPVSVEVEVTINRYAITNIKLIKHLNGQGEAAEVITDKVVDAQTLDVDVVSGATYSSKVILKAIEDALKGTN